MMAVRSPPSISSYRDVSNPYSEPQYMSSGISAAPASTTNSTLSGSAADSTDAPSAPAASEQAGNAEMHEGNGDEETFLARPGQAPGATPIQSDLTIETRTHHVESNARSDEDEPPQSVIHAPPGFGDFATTQGSSEICEGQDSPSPDPQRSESVELPQTVKVSKLNSETEFGKSACGLTGQDVKLGNSPISPPPLTTSVTPAKYLSERATPRAQTRLDFEACGRHTRSSSLEDIPEGADSHEKKYDNPMIDPMTGCSNNKEMEIHALQAALTECWTLCNTLASLSYINRERLFRSHENGMQKEVWRSCWKLCQKLYDTRDDDYAPQVNPTLDLCRDFCQALFEVRVCDNDLADSVLRVSFELNNHLYNTHDRNLPDAFRERTLDFYITLCHRLMKQRTHLTEADSLLSACWTLAEMLFSIRQSKREGKPLDEELLGSAVQACWELCDIFREGWTLHSMRNSDRGTPRPSQTTFAQAFQQVTQQSGLEFEDGSQVQLGHPETPTTIFEDTATVSPDEAPVPNILVLGHAVSHSSHPHSKWPSSASGITENSRSSGQTVSSTNTVTTVPEDPNFMRLRVLITKAALDSGYQRGGPQNLSSFVKALPTDAFGSAPWQTSLLKNYRRLVSVDPAFRNAGVQARVGAIDVARACQAMLQSGQYSWLRDLYRLVFGFHIEEAMDRRGMTIQT